MKLFRNLLIATAAVAVFSGVSAFAEEEATYDFAVDATNVATNVVSVSADAVAGVVEAMGDQVTVVVVPAGATDITDANIYYINQDANSGAATMLTAMGTKALAADTDYEVWVGGSNGTIKKGAFTTKVATPEEPDEPEVPEVEWTYGDVDGDGEPTDFDALEILFYYNFMDSVFDDGEEWRILAGDVDQDGEPTDFDALEILFYFNFMDSVLDGLLG